MYDFDYSVNIFFVNIYHIYSELAQLADGVTLENLFSLVEPMHGSEASRCTVGAMPYLN